MKKVWKYIVITLLLLLGLCCVGVLYLFFVPNSSLFNITYVNHNIIKESNKYNQDLISKIELNSRAYNVRVLSTEESTIYVKAHSNSFGFVLKDNSNLDIHSKLDNTVLTFNIDETYGFAARNASYVELYVPKDFEVDLTLKNKKAETKIGGDITINNLKYTTDKGDCDFEKGTINGTITLNLGKSDFRLHDSVTTNNNNLNLSLTSGSFKANIATLSDVTILSNARGVISLNECENLRENAQNAGGQIYVNKVQHLNITAGDTIIKVGEVTNTASVNLTKSGSITVDNLTGISTFVTNSGNINLGTTFSPLTLQSESGNINVANAFKTVAVKVNYGEAKIQFADEALSYLDENSSRVLNASVKNGKLTAYGVEHIGTPEENTQTTIDGGVKITGNGRVYINMKNVYGKNLIAGNNGSVNVVVDKDAEFMLKTSSTAGSVRVNLTQIPEYNGYTTRELRTTNVNCNSSTNLLTVNSNYGSLTVLDSNFA